MRTGIATVSLDYGKCPYWLFERMKRLSRGIISAIVEEFGPDEVLKRLSDPIWFQSFGCVLAFDWNSSGLTTTVMGALKEGLRGLESALGLFVCGGKGKTSRKTPQQIQNWGEFLGWPIERIDKMIYASKISAKVDSALIQDDFSIYHHNLIFSKSGQYAILQQGMNIALQKARRYHWLSSTLPLRSGQEDFTEEPHSGIISGVRVRPLNLTARESRENKEISAGLVNEEPKTFLKDIELISKKSDALMRQKRLGNFIEMELNDIEFHRHPVVNEKFDLKRLEKSIFFANFRKPKNFEQLLATKGIGPKTIRALSLVSELIYGAKPSYEDPVRYSFSFGGKDGTPRPVEKDLMDKAIDIIEKGIQKSKISNREKIEAKRRLVETFR